MCSHRHDVFLSRECSGIIKTSHTDTICECLPPLILYLLSNGAHYTLLPAQNPYQRLSGPWRAWALFLFCLLLNSVDMAGPGKQFKRMCTAVSSRWENVWQPSTQTRIFNGMLMGLTSTKGGGNDVLTYFVCYTDVPWGMSFTKLRLHQKMFSLSMYTW